nr:MAG TPA: hypothetical protein [Caudoviricetes sp.]
MTLSFLSYFVLFMTENCARVSFSVFICSIENLF